MSAAAGAGAYAQIAQTIANIVNSAKDRKVQREALAMQQNIAANQSQLDAANLRLTQRGDERTAQSDAYRKALMAALGAGTEDVGYSREGGFTGGLRPSALGEGGQAAAAALGPLAMNQLTNPELRPGLDAFQRINIGNQKPYEAPGTHAAGFWSRMFNPRKTFSPRHFDQPVGAQPTAPSTALQPGVPAPANAATLLRELSARGGGY